jgi:hypothetical protein
MLTTTVQFETLQIGEAGRTHMLGYYLHDEKVVASFMEQINGTRRWEIIEPPAELLDAGGLLQEFVDQLQATTNAQALVTPTETYQ